MVFGGPSPEHDVSVLTGLQAARELADSLSHTVRALYWSKSGDWFEVADDLEAMDFLDGVPKGAAPCQLVVGRGGGFFKEAKRILGARVGIPLESVVVCCHGGPGEDGSLQGALELAGVRFAGPTVAGAALGMDKLAFAAVVSGAGLAVLPRLPLDSNLARPSLQGPCIVKPRFGGSSIGIEVVADISSALDLAAANPHLRSGAVVEPYRKDLFDLQIAVRSWPSLELSAIERPLRDVAGGAGSQSEFLGYHDKYVGGEGMVSAPRELPARVSSGLRSAIQDAALHIARLTSVRGVARVDFLSDGDQLFVNELNTVPGSLARYLWVDPAIPFSTLLRDLLDEAAHRPTRSPLSLGADGSVLRSASPVAAKLA
ncbi:MAG: hypothetical protein ACRDVP_09280 [Acidimicrobiales bacterium]